MVDIKDLLFNEGMNNTLKDVTNFQLEVDSLSKDKDAFNSKSLLENDIDVFNIQAKLKDYSFDPEIVNSSSFTVEYSNVPNVHKFFSFADKAGQHLCAHKNKMDPLIYGGFSDARPKMNIQQSSKKTNLGTRGTTGIISGGKSDFCLSSKILSNFNHYTRNPFLHHWEADEDRPGGGSWIQRKDLYDHIASKFSKSDLYSIVSSESRKENVHNPAKKRRRNSNCTESGISESLIIDDHSLALLNTFRPELSGYRWSEEGDEELLLFWR